METSSAQMYCTDRIINRIRTLETIMSEYIIRRSTVLVAGSSFMKHRGVSFRWRRAQNLAREETLRWATHPYKNCLPPGAPSRSTEGNKRRVCNRKKKNVLTFVLCSDAPVRVTACHSDTPPPVYHCAQLFLSLVVLNLVVVMSQQYALSHFSFKVCGIKPDSRKLVLIGLTPSET